MQIQIQIQTAHFGICYLSIAGQCECEGRQKKAAVNQEAESAAVLELGTFIFLLKKLKLEGPPKEKKRKQAPKEIWRKATHRLFLFFFLGAPFKRDARRLWTCHRRWEWARNLQV
jgi:hypothetical protein